MRKPDVYLKEYCQKLSDDNLKLLGNRLSQKMSGDLGDVLEFLSNNREMDRWLASAQTSIELYDMIDAVGESVATELQKRNVVAA
jgi:hypothetical protein